MKSLVIVLWMASVLGAQEPKSEPNSAAPDAVVPAGQIPQRHELMRNKKVIVSTTELAPGKSVPMHRHEHDYITVVLTDGQMRETASDQGAVKSSGKKVGRVFGAMHVPGATGDKVQAGEVVYNHAGYTHADENKGKTTMRAVTVDFLEPAGKQQDASRKSNKYCNADNKNICVDEKYLFCTDKFCVEDVTMGPGAQSTKHSHSTDHMLIAITDYQLTDNIVGKGTKVRSHKAGEVEYIKSGISHQLSNTGPQAARFIVVLFN
jgi:quercetin dioxygenase-like cupin family protein